MAFNLNGANFIEPDNDDDALPNPLLKYLQHQPPEVLSRIAKSVTPDVKQIITHNVQGLVGLLPAENFNVQVTTDRENLASLLASAMVTGYFLRQVEQRMQLDDVITDSHALFRPDAKPNSSPSQPSPESVSRDQPNEDL